MGKKSFKKYKYKKTLEDPNGQISKLNDDCMLEIFKYLSMKERVNASTVCKRWAIIYELSWKDVTSLDINKKLLQEFSLKEFPTVTNTKKKYLAIVTNILKRCGAYLQIIRFEELVGQENFSRILKIIIKYCKNIKDFSLVNLDENFNEIQDSFLESIFINNTKLCKINLDCIKFEGYCLTKLQPDIIEEFSLHNPSLSSYKYLYDFMSQLKNIKKIHIHMFGISDKALLALIKSNCDNISEFYFNFSSSASHHLSNLLFKQKNLKKLYLNHITIENNFLDNLPNKFLEHASLNLHNSINYPIQRFKNLKELNCDIDFLTDEFVNGLTECFNLNVLKIKAEDITLSKLGFYYFSKLKSLEILYFENHNKDIDEILLSVGRCENLKILKIKKCKFTESGFNGLNTFKNLTYLDISHNINTFFSATYQSILIKILSKLLSLKGLIISELESLTVEFTETINRIKENQKDKNILKIAFDNRDYRLCKKILNNNSLSLIKFEQYEYGCLFKNF